MVVFFKKLYFLETFLQKKNAKIGQRVSLIPTSGFSY